MCNQVAQSNSCLSLRATLASSTALLQPPRHAARPSVAGHERVEEVTNIVLDHTRAARLALEHLKGLGHPEIAFIKGQTLRSDSSVRWSAICEVADEVGALFAYNDIFAIGSIWAFGEAGLRVPQDISVVGFDDIPGAAFTNPGLTTVRQPLLRMGQVAAQTLVDQIEGHHEYAAEIAIEPEFVIRESTSPCSSGSDW